jgi:hypothetical protein
LAGFATGLVGALESTFESTAGLEGALGPEVCISSAEAEAPLRSSSWGEAALSGLDDEEGLLLRRCAAMCLGIFDCVRFKSAASGTFKM